MDVEALSKQVSCLVLFWVCQTACCRGHDGICDPELGVDDGCETFEGFTYGVSTKLGGGTGSTGPTSIQGRRRTVTMGDLSARVSASSASETRYARATLIDGDLSLLSLGVKSIDYSPHNSFGNNDTGAEAYAATAISVINGGPLVEMSILIHGYFTEDAGPFGHAGVELSVRDFQGRALGAVNLSRSPLNNIGRRVITWPDPFDQDSSVIEDFTGNYNTAELTFYYPNLPDNGIFIRMASGANMVDPVALSVGANFSSSAVLTVNPPEGTMVQLGSGQTFEHRDEVPEIEIYRQPSGRSGLKGDDLILNVGAVSREEMSFQWYFNDEEMTGQTNPDLEVADAQKEDSGVYQVKVSTAGLEVWSEETNIEVLSDQDGDGLPDSWETEYGLNPEVPNDPETNSDEDLFTDLEEYLAGTSPTDSSSHLKFEGIERNEDRVGLLFNAAAYRSYSFYWKADLESDNWRHFTDVQASSEDELVRVGNELIYTVPRYYRIQANGFAR